MRSRLIDHLSSFRKVNINDLHWKFMFDNLSRICVIIKMLNISISGSMMQTVEYHDTLINLNYHQNFVQVTVNNSLEHGCYLVYDQVRGVFVRAGSASSKLGHKDAKGQQRGRINDHIKAANTHQKKSVFYSSYPSKNYSLNSLLRKGCFEDLEFVAPIRFKDTDKVKIQNLFYWDTDVINYLNERKPKGCVSIEDKKHRLLCYFFESSIQTMLSPLNNVSRNPGCETFSLVFDEGYDSNINIGDTLELDIETCDLLPVVIDTSV